MATIKYEPALKEVLRHEGGYSNHPADPGGATMRGVTQRVYDAERKRRRLPTRSVRQISDDELQAIYRQQYWDKILGDQMPPGVDYVVFDGAVNSGVAQSVKWLQRAVGGVRVDGVVGNATLAAVWAVQDHDKLIANICAQRMSFLRALKTWGTFGKGWTTRVNGVLKVGQAWARGSVGPVVKVDLTGAAKANIEDAKALPSSGPADAAIGGGSVMGTIGLAIEGAKGALAPLAGGSQWISAVVAALVVAGAALAIGGVVWRARQKRKASEAAQALGLPAIA